MSSIPSNESKAGTENFGAFASLNRCAVIDSRISSRKEIVSTLGATSLFETVVEPDSLAEALELLSTDTFDACILGPSLTKEAADSFMDSLKEIPEAEHCAIVAIVDGIISTIDDLEQSGAHGIIESPYRKFSFAQDVTRAVLEANFHNPDQDKILKITQNLEYFSSKIQASAEGLEDESRQSINLKSEPEARPTTIIYDLPEEQGPIDPLESVRELVHRLKLAKAGSPRITEFLNYVDDAIDEWKLDKLQVSEEDATTILREKILGYAKVNIT